MDREYLQSAFLIPFELVRENLRSIFNEYGVTIRMQEDWLETQDFYWGLLDKNGQLSKSGMETMKRWKASFGDFHKEMDFAMYMID